jgi:DNA polymerase (family X)
MKTRFEIAAELRRIARLLELKGENPFKTQAYVRAADELENFDDDFDALVKAKRLEEIVGVGKTIAAVIDEIYHTGECWLFQQLGQDLPPGALELSVVPGLNLKKITALHDTLQIESIADLKTACEENLVGKVKGFGAKSQAKLLADIERLSSPKDGTLLLDQASEEAAKIIHHLHASPALLEAEVAGALRRRSETVKRICLVASSEDPKPVMDQFLRLPALAHTDELSEDRCLGRLASGVEIELVVVKPTDFILELHARTGSPDHIAKLREIARAKSLTFLSRGEDTLGEQSNWQSESEIYQRLGLPYITPELREDQGEIEAAQAGALPEPLRVEDICGMTHCHTVYSDGRNTIEEMALAAQAMGMRYLTITDHSPSAYYARGVDTDRLRAQWDEIARVQERVKIKILKGTESDILADGALDYPDHFLEQFDIIIASIHARHKMDADQMTQRLLRAMTLPIFKIWGHPLGRLLQSRPPLACRMEEVLDAAARSKCAIEINGDPHRLDLEPRWIRSARARGIKFLISTDAHSIGGLQNLSYGVATARRGWLSRADVLNTLDAAEFMAAVHP